MKDSSKDLEVKQTELQEISCDELKRVEGGSGGCREYDYEDWNSYLCFGYSNVIGIDCRN